MEIAVVGIDLGKNACSLVGLDEVGRVALRRWVRREGLERFVGGLPRCIVAMEACCGAHHLGRIFGAQGNEVRLMSPEYVRPYVKAQKNDDRDAEAIAEAATRPTMRFVPVKSVAQSDVQALHRARERLVAERTALINHLRALLLERGITAPQGRGKLAAELCTFADEEDDSRLSPRIRLLVEDLRREWRALDARIAMLERTRDLLDGCIGCGCLSLQRCALYNPGDRAARALAGFADGVEKRALIEVIDFCIERAY